MRRRSKPDWVMESEKGAWRLYVGAALIIGLVAYVMYHFDIKQRDRSHDEVVQQLLEEDEE